MYPAIFLDRDGVIIENRPSYVLSWTDVHFFPQALEALARLRDTSFKIVIVTNQSAIGRGLISPAAADEINKRLVQVIEAAGGRIDGIFLCPHAPQEGCECRKPKPGLLVQAASALSLDISQSIMVGDAISDVMAGQAAGVRCAVLVRTGRGASEEHSPLPDNIKSIRVYDTLADALADILKR